jgi:plasmid maintenance system antidote protein VapI
LENQIKRLAFSVHALSLALHIPYSRLSEIVDGKLKVSADTALLMTPTENFAAPPNCQD